LYEGWLTVGERSVEPIMPYAQLGNLVYILSDADRSSLELAKSEEVDERRCRYIAIPATTDGLMPVLVQEIYAWLNCDRLVVLLLADLSTSFF